MKIRGYRRPDGRLGIRNHALVVPTSVCSSVEAVRIAERVTGAVAIPHQHGCCQMSADLDQTHRTLAGFASHPNVGAVLVVSLGCEGVQAGAITDAARAAGKPVEGVVIQQSGGSARAVEAGVAALSRLALAASRCRRSAADLSEVILGMECGGSDATSGLVANPVMGRVSDRLVALGGTSILSETTELIGAEHVLARRARNRGVARKLLQIVRRTERRALEAGADLRGSQPTPGNIQGGLTTIEEKSLGCVHKAGTARVQGVIEYAERPAGRGLYVMDTPGQDIESITGMVAGGAQIVVFTTGRGTPTGCPIAPVIKITGNRATFRSMRDCTDLDFGRVTEGRVTMDRAADELFSRLVAVCNGRQTKAERTGHREFALYRVGFTF